MDYKKAIVLSDQHIPFHDKPANNLIFQFIKDFKPGYIDLLGDLIDFWQISKFRKDPSRRLDIQKDIDLGKEYISLLREISPSSEITLHYGNHLCRLRKYIWDKAKELESIRSLDLKFLLGLDGLHIKVIEEEEGYVIRGKLVLTHGTIISQDSAMTARRNLAKYGLSVIHGHTHRLGSFYKTDLRGTIGAWENGCIVAGSIIQLEDGSYKNIEDIKKNDRVTVGNKYTIRSSKVIKIYKHIYNGKLFGIHISGIPILWLTPEHPILTRRGWVQTKDILKIDYIKVPNRFIQKRIKLNKDKAFVIGAYLAEGSIDRGGFVTFSLNDGEILQKKLIESLNRLGYECSIIRANHTTGIRIYVKKSKSGGLGKFLNKWCDNGSHNKKLLTTNLDIQSAKIILEGWFLGDGCNSKDGRVLGSTVSKILAWQLKDLSIICGKGRPNLQESLNDAKNSRWTLAWTKTSRRSQKYRTWIKVKHIETKEYNNYVYNIEVKSIHHSYVANGLLIHNCLCDLDLIKQWGRELANWEQGFSIVFIKDHRFLVQQIPIIKGSFMIGEKLYETQG